MVINIKSVMIHKLKFNKFITVVFIFCAIIIIARILINNFTNGYKESYGTYFVEPALIGPAILLIFSKRSFTKNLLSSLLLIFLLILSSELFWNYMDKPWFSPPEPNNCDGPCYGWFSFENNSPFFEVLLVGGISVLTSSLIKLMIPIKKVFSKLFHYRNYSNKN